MRKFTIMFSGLNFLSVFSLIISLLLIGGCVDNNSANLTEISPSVSPDSVAQTQTVQATSMEPQGIQGEVLQRVGNQMPTVGNIKQRSTPQAVVTTVWIFPDSIPAKEPRIKISELQANYTAIKKVKTDGKGKFFVELPPGEYTVFAQYGEDLYLNSFTGDGTYATVTVTPNQTSEVRLVNTEKATF